MNNRILDYWYLLHSTGVHLLRLCKTRIYFFQFPKPIKIRICAKGGKDNLQRCFEEMGQDEHEEDCRIFSY